MSGGAPLIAVPAARIDPGGVRKWATGAYAVPEGYVAALRRAGARPVVVTGPDPAPPEEIVASFDGLLLPGGGDVDPARYSSRRDERIYGVDPDRDALELGLVGAAMARGVPTLAICRGAQVLNVACGGTLHQHLPGALGRGAHGDPTSHVLATHAVQVAEHSRLAAIVGAGRLAHCTSIHHQGIDRIGEGLVAVAWSEDGLVEALEPAARQAWVVAVQWHPEVTAADDAVQQSLFDALASEARRCSALV